MSQFGLVHFLLFNTLCRVYNFHTERLPIMLRENYMRNRIDLPVRNQSQNVDVGFRLTMASPFGIHLKHETLLFTAWLQLEWKDEFIGWNTQKYGRNYMAVPLSELWTPKLAFPAKIGVRLLIDRSKSAMVTSTGQVVVEQRIQIQHYCPVKLDLFPFGMEVCSLTVTSWAYDTSEINLHFLRSPIAIDVEYKNSAFLNNYKVARVEACRRQAGERRTVKGRKKTGKAGACGRRRVVRVSTSGS